MIRKNRRELNSYSPSKYIGCKKSQKELVRYYVHKLFLLMEGGLKLENVRNLGKPESLSRASSGVRIYSVLLEFLAVHQDVGLGEDGVDVFDRCFCRSDAQGDADVSYLEVFFQFF